MAEITNLRQIIRFFRDDEDTQMAWSRWLGRGAARLEVHEDVTLMDLCNLLSIPVKLELGTTQCYLGFIHELPPLNMSHQVNDFPRDMVAAHRAAVERTIDKIEKESGLEQVVIEFCRIRRQMMDTSQAHLHLQSFLLYCRTMFDPSRGWSLLTPPEVDDMDRDFHEITYAGEHATKEMLLNALDLWVLMECDDQEEYETRTRYYCEELDAADQIIRRYGLQIEPQTLEHMQDVFYSITNSERYLSLGNRAIGCVYACLNGRWDGIGPWRK